MDKEYKRPCTIGVRVGGKSTIYDLFRPNHKITYASCRDNLNSIKEFILTANAKSKSIITTDFKQLIKTLNLPCDNRVYKVYDLHLHKQIGHICSTGNQSKDHNIVRRILEKMETADLNEYQLLISNASIVYHDIESRGIVINDLPVYPKWSLNTYSGRSKSTEFNIQGHHEEDKITAAGMMNNSVLLHFDWIAADIRVASLLSNDQKLKDSFNESDPYQYMMEIIGQGITREECKVALLKSINSMDVSSVVLTQIFQRLGDWISECKHRIESIGVLESILSRKFKMSSSKNALAMLNGVMQGSVVHAMQSVVRRVWEKLSPYMIAEIHDSLIMCVPADNSIIRSTISIVAPMMLRPFDGLLPSNPSFPLKVSVGKKWKNWKLLETHRASGVVKC